MTSRHAIFYQESMEEPKCASCGGPAVQRCSRCKYEWLVACQILIVYHFCEFEQPRLWNQSNLANHQASSAMFLFMRRFQFTNQCLDNHGVIVQNFLLLLFRILYMEINIVYINCPSKHLIQLTHTSDVFLQVLWEALPEENVDNS
jgi:hypothetical protein